MTKAPKTRPQPWGALAGTGNGIGNAPFDIEDADSMTDDAFEEFVYGVLYDDFLHQGTIYAATPLAIHCLLERLEKFSEDRISTLLFWVRDCFLAELLGEAKPSDAGVWLPKEDREQIHSHALVRPTVKDVIKRHHQKLQELPGAKNQELVEFLVGMSDTEG